MKLSDFIRANIEQISSEWEKFAATLLPDDEFSASVLRNGIVDILREIAQDMDRVQNAQQQQEKSEGESDSSGAEDNAAEIHALARVRMGLSSRQLISEFRALRATILRLWGESEGTNDKYNLYDVTRFNEAIDQALTEAAVRYSEKIEQSRELFLGILAHDLRTPLGAISGLADLLMLAQNPDRSGEFISQISISAKRMTHMITDLIELTRVQLGAGISVNPSPTDMHQICASVLAEMEALYPQQSFQLVAHKPLMGEWDEPRISQVLSNLLGNAVQHGARDSAITVTAKKKTNAIEVTVHNHGPAISPELLPILFDRFVQGKAGFRFDEGRSANLGLGLYIAKEIVLAHGGTIDVRSSDSAGTNFVVCFPRKAD
jgi:signal transduction histidine kinase